MLLDVRSPEAFANGHADGAVNLPHKLITGDRFGDPALTAAVVRELS